MENIKQFSTEKANLLFVEVPKDATRIRYSATLHEDLSEYLDVLHNKPLFSFKNVPVLQYQSASEYNNLTADLQYLKLPNGSWTLAGSIGEVKAEVADKIFDKIGGTKYINPKMPFHECLSENHIHILQSLCASLNLLETNTQLLYELKN